MGFTGQYYIPACVPCVLYLIFLPHSVARLAKDCFRGFDDVLRLVVTMLTKEGVIDYTRYFPGTSGQMTHCGPACGPAPPHIRPYFT